MALRGFTPKIDPIPVFGIHSAQDEWMTEGQMRRSGRHVSGPWRYE